MRIIRIFGALAVGAIAAAGCEEITNPVEDFGEFAPPFVQFDGSVDRNGPHGSMNAVVFEAPPRPEEDVVVDFTLGGTAVFGDDYEIVNADGTARTDITAAGGSVTISGDPAREESHDTVWVFVPEDATVGSVLEITITSAATADGDSVVVGRLGDNDVLEITITAAPAEIPTGTYDGVGSGDFGALASTVEITDDPVTIAGTEFRYQISDFAFNLFGIPIPHAFNVLTDGTVNFAPHAVGFSTVVGDASGTFDFTTNELTMDYVFQCCNVAGVAITGVYTLQ